MVSLIALVLGSYVLAALSVHLIRYYGRRHRSLKSQHYVLYARNDASRMEWFLRSIGWYSRRSGTEVRVTVIDCGSSDETLAIVGRFAQNGMGCAVESQPPDRQAGADAGRRNKRTVRHAKAGSGKDAGPGSDAKAHTHRQVGPGGHFSPAGECARHNSQSVFVDLNRPEDLEKLPLF